MCNKNMKLTLLVIMLVLGCVYSNGGSQRKGGVQDHEFKPEEDQIDRMALDASLKYIKNQNADLQYKGVQECRTQVVAGMKYYLTLNFININTNKVEQYEFIIYTRPWEEFIEVQEVKKLEESDEITSDLSKNIDLRNLIKRFLYEQVKGRVNFDLSNFEVSDLRVVEQKLVAGDLYKLVVQFKNGEQIKEYFVEVWSRPWLNPSLELVSVKDHKEEQREHVPRTLRAENVAGGFQHYEWDNQGENEQVILLELKKYLQGLIRTENIQIFDIYDTLVKPLAVLHYKLTMSYSVDGKDKKAAHIELTYNSRTKSISISAFIHAPPPKEMRKDGGFEKYKWDSNGEIEKKVISFLSEYGTTNISPDFTVKQIYQAESKIVNGVIFKLHLNFQSSNTSLNATTEIYAQVWTNTYEILSFIKDKNSEL